MSTRSWLEKLDERTARGMSLDDARNSVVALVDEVRRRGQMLARQPKHLIPIHDAWKAFRMGIVASCPHIPQGGDTPEVQAFWRTMRERFMQWWKTYEDGNRKARNAEPSISSEPETTAEKPSANGGTRTPTVLPTGT